MICMALISYTLNVLPCQCQCQIAYSGYGNIVLKIGSGLVAGYMRHSFRTKDGRAD